VLSIKKSKKPEFWEDLGVPVKTNEFGKGLVRQKKGLVRQKEGTSTTREGELTEAATWSTDVTATSPRGLASPGVPGVPRSEEREPRIGSKEPEEGEQLGDLAALPGLL